MRAEAIALPGSVSAGVHLSRHVYQHLGSWVLVAEAWEYLVAHAPAGCTEHFRNGHAPPHAVDDAVRAIRAQHQHPNQAGAA